MRVDDEAANDTPGDARDDEPAHTVIWEVIEEHLDELEFCVTRVQRVHEHPLMTLAELARGAEARLQAHLDALVVAGPEVGLEVTRRLADELDPERPARVTAVALAVTTSGLDELATPFFRHEDPRVRLAAVRGFTLAASERLDEAAKAHLAHAKAKAPGEVGAWLELAGRRNLQPSVAAALVRSADTDVVAAALRCLRQPIPSLSSALEGLVEHADPLVRERALRVALAWRTPGAFGACEHQALDEAQVSPLAMTAYAILGGPRQHARLAKSAETKERRPHVLRALGFSGIVAVVPELLERLDAKNPIEARIAAQAIAAIVGLDLRLDGFAAKKIKARAPDDALPPLEEDDLDADLVPAPEDALPLPNAGAIRAWWMSRAAELELKQQQRLVFGVPRTPEALLDALERRPLGLRQGWSLASFLWSGGLFWLDGEGLSAAQRAQLSAARVSVGQWSKRGLGIE